MVFRATGLPSEYLRALCRFFNITFNQVTLHAADPQASSNGNGFGPGQQDWGFVEVRKGAHKFWWLYLTTTNAEPTTRPLAIWLQGGPGASSTGYGNFEEIGPLQLDQSERNYTWVKDMNVLFIDSPVGSGFSYVDDHNLLTTDNAQIADDLVELMRGFYKVHPEFVDVPLHIFAESYGSKVGVQFAYNMHQVLKIIFTLILYILLV